jgi:Flp pilus assembly pilin Flp
MKKSFSRLLTEEDGQDLVEYSLLLAFIALAAAALLSAVSRNVVTLWQDCSNAFSQALSGAS